MREVPFPISLFLPFELTLVIFLVLSSTVLMAQSTRTVRTNLARETGPHSDVTLRVVGAGRAEDGLRADWQAELPIVQRVIGFHYVRMHGILNDESREGERDESSLRAEFTPQLERRVSLRSDTAKSSMTVL